MADKEINYNGNVIMKNSSLSLVYKGVSMVLSLISAPLLLEVLGNYKYGIFTSVLSIVSWIYYFDLGIGNGLRFRLTEFLAKKDDEGATKTVTIAYVLVSGVMLVVAFISGIILFFFDVTIKFNLSESDENLNFIIFVSIILACLNFIFSLVNNILLAIQESSKVNLFALLGQVFYILGIYFYKKWGISLILMVAIAEGGAQLLKNVIESIYVYKRYPKLKPKKNSVDFKYSKGIMSFGLKMFALQIAALILNSTDNLLILKFFGADAVTPYSFVYKYFGMINTVFSIIINPIMSAYTMAYAKKDYQWIQKTFNKSMLLYGVVAVGSVVATFIFKPFAKIWLHQDLGFDNSLIVLTLIYYLLLMFGHPVSSLINGIGKVNESTIAIIIQSLVNIPLSILFAVNFEMGVDGIVLGSIASMIVPSIVIPFVCMRELRKMKREKLYEKA